VTSAGSPVSLAVVWLSKNWWKVAVCALLLWLGLSVSAGVQRMESRLTSLEHTIRYHALATASHPLPPASLASFAESAQSQRSAEEWFQTVHKWQSSTAASGSVTACAPTPTSPCAPSAASSIDSYELNARFSQLLAEASAANPDLVHGWRQQLATASTMPAAPSRRDGAAAAEKN
jgi:hypothetical protein